MKRNVLLSIIIVTYNREKEVIRAINSCLNVGFEEYEIIIWDNSSDKKTSIHIEEYCGKLNNPKISYFCSDKNLGAGGGKNAAWLKSSGEYVLILDDDAIIYSDNFFNTIVDYMKERLYVGAAFVEIFEPSTGHSYDCIYKRVNKRGEIESFAFVGGTHIVRRSAIKNRDLYPPQSKFGSEETYASLTIWNNGFEVHKIPYLKVLHLPTAKNRKCGKERDKQFIISAYAIKKMIFPKIFMPIEYILFRIHLLKNGIIYTTLIKEQIKKVCINNQSERIKIRTIYNLVKKFGVKCVL